MIGSHQLRAIDVEAQITRLSSVQCRRQEETNNDQDSMVNATTVGFPVTKARIVGWTCILLCYVVWRYQDQFSSSNYIPVTLCPIYYYCGTPLDFMKNIKGTLILFLMRNIYNIVQNSFAILYTQRRTNVKDVIIDPS